METHAFRISWCVGTFFSLNIAYLTTVSSATLLRQVKYAPILQLLKIP